MGSFNWREQKVMKATDRSFAATGILGPTRDDLTVRDQRYQLPGRREWFRAVGPGLAIRPAHCQIHRSGQHRSVYQLPLRLYARHRHHPGERAKDVAVARIPRVWQAKEHVVSLEYLRAENEATSRVAPSPINQFIPATSPFFPAGAPVTAVPGFGDWRDRQLARSACRQAHQRRRHDDRAPAARPDGRRGGLGLSPRRRPLGKRKYRVSQQRLSRTTRSCRPGVIAGVVNPFGPQTAAGQAVLDAAPQGRYTLIGNAKVDFFDARVTKDLFQMPAGPLSMALGYEWRKEESQL